MRDVELGHIVKGRHTKPYLCSSSQADCEDWWTNPTCSK
jgi:hypothetical protein